MKTGHSISRQFAVIFTFIMAVALALVFLANNLLLKRFYLSNRHREIRSAYNSINEAEAHNSFDTEEYDNTILHICEKYSLDIMVMDGNSQTIKSAGNDANLLKMRLWDRIFSGAGPDNDNRASSGDELLEINDQYSIILTKDIRSGSDYIEMWGTLDSGNIFLIRSAIESIDNSVSITNRFLGYMSVVAIIVCAIVITLVSKKITHPILDLADISEKMTNLEFDRKYVPAGHNEITLLGENINKLSDSLEKNISDLKSANARLKRDIEEKTEIDEMRKEFLSNVSHELKTPIALIQGYAEGLAEGVTNDPKDTAYYCEVIRDEAAKMNNLVQKLLTLNQLEFGENTVNMERFDIVGLIGSLVQTTGILTKQNDISVSYPNGEPIYVWGDEFMVEEILTNYLSNAINHCAGDKKIDICVGDTSEGNKVRVSVFNTGEPIPEENMEHIWEKFYKVDKARTRAYGGSGVGLSIVAAICRSMDQEYGAENYDNGVGFYFTLDKR